jgi:hypothetical protein
MNMDMPKFLFRASVFIFISLWFLTSCAPASTPTPFRPPTKPLATEPLPTTTPVPQLFTPIPTNATPSTPTATPPCFNDLTFEDDVTVEDGTVVSPGASIDKQWLVTNSGTCNWDSRYRLKLIGGGALGAATEQALYPARAGTQATLQIIFTAPTEAGTYDSAWQAYDPQGAAFGDYVSIKIIVSP